MASSASSNSIQTKPMEEIRAEKQNLRKVVRASVRQLTEEEIIEQSAKVWERLFHLPEYKQAQSIGLFLSMPKGEIKTDQALQQALADGKTVFVPRVGLDFEKCDMDLIRVVTTSSDNAVGKDVSSMFYDNWPRNKWGIPEPPPSAKGELVANPGDIDLLIVPGVAFDKHGNRLGQGKGYYDRFIATMRPKTKEGEHAQGSKEGCIKPILTAVGLAPQYLGGEECEQGETQVPTSPHDYPMDIMLFPQCSIQSGS